MPEVIKNIWNSGPELQKRIPHLNDLTREQNIMAWAQTKGREKHPEIDEYIRQMKPFNKSGDPDRSNRDAIRQLPFFEPSFGAIGFNVNDTLETKQEQAVARDFNLLQKVNYVIKTKGLKALLQRIIMYLKNHQVNRISSTNN